jgi:ribonucleoside-triphosphate reductase
VIKKTAGNFSDTFCDTSAKMEASFHHHHHPMLRTNNEDYVAKRDGRLEKFSSEKLTISLQKAACSLSMDASNINIQSILRMLRFSSAPLSTEEIQRASEFSLKSQGFHQVSSAFRSYSIERTKARESKSSLMQTYSQIATSSAKDFDLKRSNANVDGDTAMGKMLQFGSEASKELSLTIMLNSKHSRAHKQGDIHIHDLDFLSIGTLTCCQIDIEQLFEHGFSTGHGFVRTPNSIRASAALTSIVLQANQNEQHGGQSVPALDYALAVSVRRSFAISIAENVLKFISFSSDSEAKIEDIRELLSGYDIKLNSVSTDTLKDLQNEILRRFEVDVSMSQMESIVKQSIKDTRRECFRAIEALIHDLNAMRSRAGAQVPFTSVNLGADISPEGRLVIETFLEAIMVGLGHGETPIFLISIFKVKEGINYNPNDPKSF